VSSLNSLRKTRGALWLFGLTLLSGLWLPGFAERKTKFESGIFSPMRQLETDGFCGSLSGSLSAGDFFQGLPRVESESGVEFRRKSKVVRQFPDELDIALQGPPGSCPLALPNSQTGESPDEFVRGLSVEAQWVDRDASPSIRDHSVSKSPPRTRWFAEYEKPTWGFKIQVLSQDVAITRALVVSLISASGDRVANSTFSL
jgi:hypothetical protein